MPVELLHVAASIVFFAVWAIVIHHAIRDRRSISFRGHRRERNATRW